MPGIYISYPFCRQKCTYCNFASGVFPGDLEPRYMAALAREIATHEFRWRPETVYLGGGTPSLMDLPVLALVPGYPWTEATLEAAPGTITPERAHAWREAGINRVSLGVQSFVDAEIRRTGRKHTAGIVAQEMEILRTQGIANINVDLIAGLPAQTKTSWSESLDWIERLAPGHVSVYILEIDEDSRLGREMMLGGVRYGAADAPSEELTAELYETAVERLAQMDIHRYEISNFARPGFESKHNLKYWRMEPYVGFGADAHSFDHGLRWRNVESPQDYVNAVCPRAETLTEKAGERFFLGLRLSEGLPADDLDMRALQRHFEAGLLETREGRTRLTSRGILFSNEVFQEFVT